MRSLYNRKGPRGGERERGQFAFFVIGAIVVMTVVFVAGLQVGRVIEKGARKPEAPPGRIVVAGSAGDNGGLDIRKELGAYSEDAAKIKAVPPPSAKDRVRETEKSVTFRETLAKKDPAPVPLERAAKAARPHPAASARAAEGGGFVVQAGAYKRKATADSALRRLAGAGYPAAVRETGGKGKDVVYRVIVGPYAAREEAVKAAKRLKAEMKINAFPSAK